MRTESIGGRSAKQKYWQDHIRAWEESGLSQAAYCEANLLAIQTFGYWRRKLKVSGEAASPRFFPLAVMSTHSAAASGISRIKLTLQEKRFSIEVDDDFSTTTLQRLIATLEQVWDEFRGQYIYHWQISYNVDMLPAWQESRE